MKKEIREKLEMPFAPEQIRQRQGKFGQMLDYIEGHEVIQKLNDAFESDWSFEITWHDIREDEVIVIGRLKACGEIIKEAFGGSTITRARDDGSIISLSDDLKSACTDALKKASVSFGIGLHLYRNHRSPTPNNSNYPSQRDHDNSTGTGHNRGNDGNSNGRATVKQQKYTVDLARKKGLSNRDLRDLCVDTFGKTIDYLSRSEISEIIQELSAK